MRNFRPATWAELIDEMTGAKFRPPPPGLPPPDPPPDGGGLIGGTSPPPLSWATAAGTANKKSASATGAPARIFQQVIDMDGTHVANHDPVKSVSDRPDTRAYESGLGGG